MNYRSADRLDTSALGQRVTIRRRLADGGASDTIGILEALDASRATVRDKHGALIEIALSDIVATRVIARPRPPGSGTPLS